MHQLMYEHKITPLLSIKPDLWKNIPHPIVDTIKSLITAQFATFERHNALDTKLTQGLKKTSYNMMKLDKQLGQSEQSMHATLELVKNRVNGVMSQMRSEIDGLGVKMNLRIEETRQEAIEQQKESTHKMIQMTDKVEKEGLKRLELMSSTLKSQIESVQRESSHRLDELVRD